MSIDELVFDLGFHNGDDTDFYLAKGCKVVAVEANPVLAEAGRKRFATQISAGRLTLIDKAISDAPGKTKFYIHPNNSDWSSCFFEIVTSDGSAPMEVEVETLTITDLFNAYGVPHYMKVDLEGFDVLAARQIFESPIKPRYVSFETSRRDYAGIFSYLYVAGYKRFQLVNQANNPNRNYTVTVNGEPRRYEFSKFSSGLYGQDLPENAWLNFDDTLSRYMKYKELKQLDNKELGLGWVDVHACID